MKKDSVTLKTPNSKSSNMEKAIVKNRQKRKQHKAKLNSNNPRKKIDLSQKLNPVKKKLKSFTKIKEKKVGINDKRASSNSLKVNHKIEKISLLLNKILEENHQLVRDLKPLNLLTLMGQMILMNHITLLYLVIITQSKMSMTV